MRYDYSLDIGQSIKSEEELKEQEKQQASQENTPSSGEELSAKRIEEELKQEAEKKAAEKHEEQPAEEKNEDNSAESKEDLTVKEISFEKAELIEEHKKAQETIESLEKKSEEDTEDEDSEDKPKDELEEDVNEIIEDSFKEPQEYITTKNNDVKEYVPEHKNYAIPLALALILLGAIVFGFVYFMHPGGTAPAATAGIPGEEINLAPVPEEEPEITEPEELPVAPENKDAAENKTLPANESSSAVEAIKAPARKQTSKSEEQALNDILLSGLKD